MFSYRETATANCVLYAAVVSQKAACSKLFVSAFWSCVQNRHAFWAKTASKSSSWENLQYSHVECGITVREAHCLPELVVRKCKAFVLTIFKVSDFTQKMEIFKLKLKQNNSVQSNAARNYCHPFEKLFKSVATNPPRPQAKEKALRSRLA